jgi:hypothetical protein
MSWAAPITKRRALIACAEPGCRRVLTVNLLAAIGGERPNCAPCTKKRDGRKVHACRRCHQPKKGHVCTAVAQVSK